MIQSSTGILFRVDPKTGVATAVDLGGVALTNSRTLYVVQNPSGKLVDQRADEDFQVPLKRNSTTSPNRLLIG